MENAFSLIDLIASAVGGLLLLLISTIAFFIRSELHDIRAKIDVLLRSNEQHNIGAVEVSAQMQSLSERILRLEKKADL
jgi:hypothetical protein